MVALPILLIHGFNGQPANWTDPEDRFPEFLGEHGFDPELIRIFSYGFTETKGEPIYNATGDMRAIAHRLAEADSADPETRQAAVEQLSRDSVARGGPAKITIIAHSSGGLIARYYLACQTEDPFRTRYRGNVARLIMLGTPHLGVEIEQVFDPLPTPIVFSVLAHLHPAFPHADLDDIQEMRGAMQELHQSIRNDSFGVPPQVNTTAYEQIHPKSEFLRELNRPGAMPNDVAYFNIAGDIRVKTDVRILNRPLLVREKSLGDLLVSRDSACTIPNAASRCDTIVERHELEVALGGRGLIHAHVQVSDGRPSPIHRRLRSLPEAREKILGLLANDV